MKTITKIEVQKKRKGRCSVYLDEEFGFGIDQNVLLQFGLNKGDQLSDEKIKEILIIEENHRAKEKAIRLLSYRDRSEKEIIKKLKEAGYKQNAIEWTIAELKRLKLIDDSRFAVSFAKTKMVTKPSGEYLIRRELTSKGIEDELIDVALENAYGEKSQYEIATEIAEKRLKRYHGLDEDKTKRKICDFLLRRGFSWDVVNDVLERFNTFK